MCDRRWSIFGRLELVYRLDQVVAELACVDLPGRNRAFELVELDVGRLRPGESEEGTRRFRARIAELPTGVDERVEVESVHVLGAREVDSAPVLAVREIAVPIGTGRPVPLVDERC